MLPEIGYLSLIGSLVTALLLLLLPFLPRKYASLPLIKLLTGLLFLFALSAISILAYSFAQDDFSVLYVAAQQEPGEAVSFFNDSIDGGSISMTGARIG